MNQTISTTEQAAIRDLLHVVFAVGVDLMAVGANARALVFDRPNNLDPHRATEDWDFGVSVQSWDVFREILNTASKKQLFQQHPKKQQKLIHIQTGIEIDLVPFGGVENEGWIIWPESRNEMNVTAFRDAFDKSVEVEVGPGLTLRIPPTPLQVALKLLALADRAAETDRDVLDLRHILSNYPTQGREGEVFEAPLTEVSDKLNWEYLGSLLLGLDMSSQCHPKTLDAIASTLDDLAKPFGPYTFVVARSSFTEEEERRRREHFADSFSWVRMGIRLGRADQ